MQHFSDGKDGSALRTIGEVSKALGIKQHVLRYWEQQFPTLKPLKRSGGRRYYRKDDIALLTTIARLLNEKGYTIKGAKEVIREKSSVVSSSDQGLQDQAVYLQNKEENQLDTILPQLKRISQKLHHVI